MNKLYGVYKKLKNDDSDTVYLLSLFVAQHTKANKISHTTYKNCIAYNNFLSNFNQNRSINFELNHFCS